jgi:hypothetical protein
LLFAAIGGVWTEKAIVSEKFQLLVGTEPCFIAEF